MRKTQQIQYLHLANMAWFIALGLASLLWMGLPAWIGLAGVGLLYGSLFIESVLVRQLLEGYEGATPPAIRSLKMTWLLIGAMSIFIIAAFLGRIVDS